MLRRLTIAGIVFFWLLMNGALLNLWLYPESTEILTVPVAYVSKLLFLCEQPSALTIYQNNRRAGDVRLQLRRDDSAGLRLVAFSGDLLLQLPLLEQQDFRWTGEATLDRTFALRRLKVCITTRAPELSTELDVDPPHKTASYTLSRNGTTLSRKTLTLDENAARSILKDLGINPDLVAQIGTAAAPGEFSCTAHQSEVKIGGEHLAAFHVILRQSSTPMLEADISQLGQVLGIQTAIGFSLIPENLTR